MLGGHTAASVAGLRMPHESVWLAGQEHCDMEGIQVTSPDTTEKM